MPEIKNVQATRLCSIEDILPGQARGFTVKNNDFPVQLFVVRKERQVFVYKNRCPHMGTSLDWQPDQFLDPGNRLIQCSTHGALFRIDDGICIFGPCVNQSLTRVNAEIRGNDVLVFLPGSNC